MTDRNPRDMAGDEIQAELARLDAARAAIDARTDALEAEKDRRNMFKE